MLQNSKVVFHLKSRFLCWLKKTVLLFGLLISLLILSSGSCGRQYQDTPNRLWWNSLNETWQIIFLREINKLNEIPADDDLTKILNLESVECDHFPIGDARLNPLVRLKRLKSLSAGSTHISNIDPLACLDSLEFVSFADTPIENIKALRNHHNLESVYIQQTNVTDLTPLAGKEKLQVLVFDQTPVSSISPVMDLHKLSVVSFSGTKITDKEAITFIKKHPGCDILFPGNEK